MNKGDFSIFYKAIDNLDKIQIELELNIKSFNKIINHLSKIISKKKQFQRFSRHKFISIPLCSYFSLRLKTAK